MESSEALMEQRKIIIGIDFGTTYSGVAWADTSDRSLTINAIDKWPVSKDIQDGYSSPKVPTKLRYTDDGIEWGFSITPTAPQKEVIEWFKL
jgi:molecular chaperone DnaK (HSP70)